MIEILQNLHPVAQVMAVLCMGVAVCLFISKM
jgi:hypothetical protein